jgi:hypothetical protein
VHDLLTSPRSSITVAISPEIFDHRGDLTVATDGGDLTVATSPEIFAHRGALTVALSPWRSLTVAHDLQLGDRRTRQHVERRGRLPERPHACIGRPRTRHSSTRLTASCATSKAVGSPESRAQVRTSTGQALSPWRSHRGALTVALSPAATHRGDLTVAT